MITGPKIVIIKLITEKIKMGENRNATGDKIICDPSSRSSYITFRRGFIPGWSKGGERWREGAF